MKTRSFWLPFVLAGSVSAAILAGLWHYPAAKAALPVSAMPLLDGKTFPQTMKADTMNGSYEVLDLVDMQGKPGTYVTHGDTSTLGGETFLVAYYLPTTGSPRQPQSGATGQLIYINMHYIQAIMTIHPLVPGGTLPDGAPAASPTPAQ